ncbi:hypothetical protein BESB_032800 [Besnoitia besnoiti]|uniref:Uncharacterized protein n=1 Tax=Besnoitia besnoiti TaxID=94643 RepID=A0A2A9M601_BESBE|nr:uncharacterized protein BESB_032800 [Besnoitia besnoiti]PFH31083.1 hypothetical protein BESB_032800 [Besnoitia besnoiti]
MKINTMKSHSLDTTGAAAEAVSDLLEEKVEHVTDNRLLQTKVDSLEKRCAALQQAIAEEAPIGDPVWVKAVFERVYGKHTVQFDQENALSYFRQSDKRIGERGLDELYHWRDLYDDYLPAEDREVDPMLQATRRRLQAEPGAEGKRNLNSLLLSLALISGSRKASWCELIAQRQYIDTQASVAEKGDPKSDCITTAHFIAAVDRAQKVVERIRRSHIRELDYLHQQAQLFQKGGFSMNSSRPVTTKAESAGTRTEEFYNDRVLEYLFSEVVCIYKTSTGRPGFNNKCIAFLEVLRRSLLAQREEVCASKELQGWEEENSARESLDEAKATIFLTELEKGVEMHVFSAHAIPLFLY